MQCVSCFQDLKNGKFVPVGYKQSSGYMVFNLKMVFTLKVQWVKDGHNNPDHEISNDAGVVLIESIRIALMYASLDGVNVCRKVPIQVPRYTESRDSGDR